MDKYIGSKIIRAEIMSECTFLEKFKNEDVSNRDDRNGYRVQYADGYDSWSPKEVFEEAYRPVSAGEMELLYSKEASDEDSPDSES